MEYIYIALINSYFVLSRQEYFKSGLQNILDRVSYGSLTKDELKKPENEFAFLFERNYYFGNKGNIKEHFLDLSSLNITDDLLSSEIFNGFQNIRVLNLRNNGIKNLPEGIFDKMKELEIVTLKSNPIENLNADVFNGNSRLQFIEFTGTIKTDLIALLKGKTHLSNLDMRPYTFDSYDEDVFSDLTNLEEIIFGCEFIKILEKFPAILEPLSSLRKLIIEKKGKEDISKISNSPINAKIQFMSEDKINESIIDPLLSFVDPKLAFLKTKNIYTMARQRKQERDDKRNEVETILIQKDLSIDEKIKSINQVINLDEFIEMFNMGIFDNTGELVKKYFREDGTREYLRETNYHLYIELIENPEELESIIDDEELANHGVEDPSYARSDMAKARLLRLRKMQKRK